MSTDEPVVRPNLMHLGGGGRGMGHGGGGCGCGGHGEGASHGEGQGKAEVGCGCGGHGRASRDFVTIEPIAIAVEPTAQKVTQPEVVA
jgi:hypothetical protein